MVTFVIGKTDIAKNTTEIEDAFQLESLGRQIR
jgi:hypothetical protein